MLLNFTKEFKIVFQKLFFKKSIKEFELFNIHKNKITAVEVNEEFIEDFDNMKKEF